MARIKGRFISSAATVAQTRRCSSDDCETTPLEMASPVLATWMKKGHTATGQKVGSRTACGLAQRTRDASYREILHHGRPAHGSRYDVIDVEGGLLSLLRQAAVFATPTGPILDQPAQPCVDITHARLAADP